MDGEFGDGASIPHTNTVSHRLIALIAHVSKCPRVSDLVHSVQCNTRGPRVNLKI